MKIGHLSKNEIKEIEKNDEKNIEKQNQIKNKEQLQIESKQQNHKEGGSNKNGKKKNEKIEKLELDEIESIRILRSIFRTATQTLVFFLILNFDFLGIIGFFFFYDIFIIFCYFFENINESKRTWGFYLSILFLYIFVAMISIGLLLILYHSENNYVRKLFWKKKKINFGNKKKRN